MLLKNHRMIVRASRQAAFWWIAALLMISGCGFNFYEPFAPGKDENKAKVERAKVMMDEKDYAGARKLLSPMQEDSKTDSNDVRLLLAAAILGETGLDIWSIISNLLDSTSSTNSSSSSSGADSILNVFSDSLLGTGAERDAKFEGLSEALTLLRNAPAPEEKKVQNTACFFAAMLVVPTVTDTQTQLTDALTALNSISTSTDGVTCPNIDELMQPVNNLASLASNFSQTLAAAQNCSFLDFSDAAATLNVVEQRLSRLSSAADLGCALPSCPDSVPNCNSLYPSCVQTALGVGTGGASDGQISACELTLHCTPLSKCFD
jgi:hypothetical protein